MANIIEYFLFCDSEMWVIILGMRADVDDAIHVKVQVIKLRDLKNMKHIIIADMVDAIHVKVQVIKLGDLKKHKAHNSSRRGQYHSCQSTGYQTRDLKNIKHINIANVDDGIHFKIQFIKLRELKSIILLDNIKIYWMYLDLPVGNHSSSQTPGYDRYIT